MSEMPERGTKSPVSQAFEEVGQHLAQLMFESHPTQQIFEILTTMTELCRACSDSPTPYRLLARFRQITDIIDNENKYSE